MVRKGSPVRVRQRASRKVPLSRGLFAFLGQRWEVLKRGFGGVFGHADAPKWGLRRSERFALTTSQRCPGQSLAGPVASRAARAHDRLGGGQRWLVAQLGDDVRVVGRKGGDGVAELLGDATSDRPSCNRDLRSEGDFARPVQELQPRGLTGPRPRASDRRADPRPNHLPAPLRSRGLGGRQRRRAAMWRTGLPSCRPRRPRA